MNPPYTGKMVCYKNQMQSVRFDHARAKANQGIRLGDVGLVVSQSVTELKVLMKEQLVFFHIAEVEVL